MPTREVRDRTFARVVALREIAPDEAEEVALAMLTGIASGLREISELSPQEATRRMVEALGLDLSDLIAALVN